MSNNKVILLADIHFGENKNSEQTNQDLIAFCRFVTEEGLQRGINQLVILGDYFHQRDKLDIRTIDFGCQGAGILSNVFKGLFNTRPELLLGNHDLYYKNSRQVTSAEILDSYFQIIDEPVIYDNVLFSPWVTDEQDWDQLVNYYNDNEDTINYVLGHFEFSRFKMNANYIMEHGYSHKVFKNANHVFTGHYHTRQEMDNVTYIGSPIPFSFNDANDDQRGFCILDVETGEYEFVNFNKTKFLTVDYKDFLSSDYETPNDVSVRVEIEEDIDQKTMDEIKEKLESNDFRASKIQYTPNKYNEIVESVSEEDITDIDNVDASVIKYLQDSSEVGNVDNDLLVQLYQQAIEEEQ